MKFCTCRDCLHYGQPLPDAEFGKYKQCSECRKRQMEYKKHGARKLNSKGFKLRENTPIGSEPQFLAEGHKRMWQEWLKGLVRQVEHS